MTAGSILTNLITNARHINDRSAPGSKITRSDVERRCSAIWDAISSGESDSLDGQHFKATQVKTRQIIETSDLFDADFYLSQIKSSDSEAQVDPLGHYLSHGWRRGWNPNPLFSVTFYSDLHAPLLAPGSDPLSHYVELGSKMMLDPHPLFSTKYFAGHFRRDTPRHQTWLTDFLDLDSPSAPIHPIINKNYSYEPTKNDNKLVERVVNYTHGNSSDDKQFIPLFDKDYYRLQFDYCIEESDLYAHYVTIGKHVGAKPHRLFDPAFVRGQHDVKDHPERNSANIDEILDYFLYAEEKNVCPHPLIDVEFLRSQWIRSEKGRNYLCSFLEEASAAKDPAPYFDSAGYQARFGPLAPGRTPLEDFLIKINEDAEIQKSLLDEREKYDRSCRLGLTAMPVVGSRLLAPSGPAKSKLRNYPGKVAIKEKKHNVLLVAHLVGEYLFGSERSFLDMLQGLTTADINVIVALPRNVPDYTNIVRELCSSVYVFDYGWWSKDKHIDYDAVENFERIIDEHLISVVHVNTIMLRDALIAARRQSIATVIHVRELIAQDVHLQKILGVSPDYAIDQVRSYADWIIGNSDATSSAFNKRGRTYTLHNTVDGAVLANLLNAPNDRVKFGLISSNMPKKGVLDLVAIAVSCAASAPSAQFFLIGPETELTQQLKARQAKGEVPENIVFAGYAESAGEALTQINAVLSLSHFAESFGRTVLEAMAAGRPVVAYDYGAVPELITDGKTGFLVPFRDVRAAAERVRLLCEEPERLVEMGEAGRSIYNKKFAPKHYAESMNSFYCKVLETTSLRQRTIEVLPRRSSQNRTIKLRLAYFCWHFPVPSETFVLSELRELVSRGTDVIVFCRQIPNPDLKLDFAITFERVSSHAELARRLVATSRNFVHAHFTFPTVTNMVWPACELAQVPFTFIAHAQDIFRHENDRRNKLKEIGASRLCRAMFTLSKFHRDFVIERGFPGSKVVINPNAVDMSPFIPASGEVSHLRQSKRVLAVGRFVEKKGFGLLLGAAPLLEKHGIEVHIHGYGELEEQITCAIREGGLSNVVLHGPVDHAAMPQLLQSVDLFICPCVRAADGDMDGIPTTIVEAMAAGLPVMTTSVGALPEVVHHGTTGFVVDPSPEAIATGILNFYRIPSSEVQTICLSAREYAVRHHDVRRLVSTLSRVWCNEPVDIVIVSWNNLRELEMVVSGILEFTTSPHHLIICDNNSLREPVRTFLRNLWLQSENVTVVLNDSNDMVGPGTNIALGQGDGDVAIYVCGKEGVALAPNWELAFIRGFDDDPTVGLVGTIGISPTYLTGEQYPRGIKLFSNFRNQEFAFANPKRVFGHVQGGLFAMRRRMVEEIGGFSSTVPHDYTDVEYSFFAESCGWQLKEIDNVLALFNKSRPTLSQRFRSGLVCAHPVLPSQLKQFRGLLDGKLKHCNICDWYGSSFTEQIGCVECDSGPEDRTLYRWLGESIYMYRRLPALAVGLQGKLCNIWAEQFQGPRLPTEDFTSQVQQAGRLPNRTASLNLACIRTSTASIEGLAEIAPEVHRLLQANAPLVLQNTDVEGGERSKVKQTVGWMENFGFEFQATVTYNDSACRFSQVPLLVFGRSN